MDPCARVRESCEWIKERSAHVLIDKVKLAKLADQLAAATGTALPAWDESGWHFDADAASSGPLTAQYVLVLDALNFCFWPSTTAMEYDTLAVALKKQLENDAHAFDADRLKAVTAAEVKAWFAPHDMPEPEERARKLNELGDVLASEFNGQVSELVKRADGSAVKLVRLLIANFPGFRDESVYKGRQVFLYKRAQIFVADLWAAYGKLTVAGSSPYAFPDISKLTCFADYRIPQLLRAMGVFKYSSQLSSLVDLKGEVPSGSDMEVEVRGCTVYAVEKLRSMVNERLTSASAAAKSSGESGAAASGAAGGEAPLQLTAVEVDWYLWQQGEAQKDAIPPHHRTLTVFY